MTEEIMAKNSSTLAKDVTIQIQKAEQIQNRINPKKFIPRHFIIKIMGAKDKQISRKKQNFKLEGWDK